MNKFLVTILYVIYYHFVRHKIKIKKVATDSQIT